MTGAPVPVRVLCARTIANVSPGLSRALSLDPGQNSIALLATDCDDVTYLALDEATKAANVSVVYGRSLYAGAGNAPTPLTGEVIGLLAGPTPADARSGLAAALAPEHPIYEERPNAKQEEYIRRLVAGVAEHAAELDGDIEKYAKGWRFERISLVASAIMRVAMYEMLYMADIPAGVAINEAVEIAKNYESPEVVRFINGILGSFVRGELKE